MNWTTITKDNYGRLCKGDKVKYYNNYRHKTVYGIFHRVEIDDYKIKIWAHYDRCKSLTWVGVEKCKPQAMFTAIPEELFDI